MSTKKERDPQTPVTDERVNESRRAALRKILIGGGAITGAKFLPDEWTKPIVNAIVVPAHAQSTGPTTAPPTTTTSTTPAPPTTTTTPAPTTTPS